MLEIFVYQIGMKGPNSRYRDDVVDGLPGGRRFVEEHLQKLDNVLANAERAEGTISGERAD
jgi:hypothetical protein